MIAPLSQVVNKLSKQENVSHLKLNVKKNVVDKNIPVFVSGLKNDFVLEASQRNVDIVDIVTPQPLGNRHTYAMWLDKWLKAII